MAEIEIIIKAVQLHMHRHYKNEPVNAISRYNCCIFRESYWILKLCVDSMQSFSFQSRCAVIHCALKVCYGMNGQSVEGVAHCPLPVSSFIRDTGNIVERPNDNSVPGHTTVLPTHLQNPTDNR